VSEVQEESINAHRETPHNLVLVRQTMALKSHLHSTVAIREVIYSILTTVTVVVCQLFGRRLFGPSDRARCTKLGVFSIYRRQILNRHRL